MDMDDSALISTARRYFNGLSDHMEGLALLHSQFREAIEIFSQNRNTRNKLTLECLVAYFEKTIAQELERSDVSLDLGEENETVRIDLDGAWRAFDFDHFFEGVDTLNKLLVIEAKLRAPHRDIRIEREMTRHYVYREARLYYYVAQFEELRVREVRFASPGFASFQGLAGVTKELRRFIQYIVSIRFVKDWLNVYHQARKIRQEKELDSEKHKLALMRIHAQMRELERKQEIAEITHGQEVVRVLNRGIEVAIDMDARGLADGMRVADRFVNAVERLHQLGFESRKIAVKGPEQ